jgi:hypothetical protein
MDHSNHGEHDHAAHKSSGHKAEAQNHATAQSLNVVAFWATLHCLSGCAVGEVLGMIIGTAFGLSNGVTIALSVGLAFVFGYAFTVTPLLRSGIHFRRAAGIAVAADTLSIAIMEVVDNLVMLAVPGAMDASLADLLFWGSLAGSLVIAGVAAYPANRWLIARGAGHAVVHAHHHHRSPAKLEDDGRYADARETELHSRARVLSASGCHAHLRAEPVDHLSADRGRHVSCADPLGPARLSMVGSGLASLDRRS